MSTPASSCQRAIAAALERLVRYLLRPALSLKRLSLRDDDVVVYRLQRPDRRGRTALFMTPQEFLARLVAIMPAPRLALRRQLGVFASGSPDRRRIMPAPAPSPSCRHAAKTAPTRVPWAGAASPRLALRRLALRKLRRTPAPSRPRPGPRGGSSAICAREGSSRPYPWPRALAALRPRWLEA